MSAMQRERSLPTPRRAPRAAWGALAENQPAGVDTSTSETALARHRLLERNAEEEECSTQWWSLDHLLPMLLSPNAPSSRDPSKGTLFSSKLGGKKQKPMKEDFDSDTHSTFGRLLPEPPRGTRSSWLPDEGVMRGERPEAPEQNTDSSFSKVLGGAVASVFHVLRPSGVPESRSRSLPRHGPAVAWG